MAIEPSKYQIAIQHAQLTTENNMAIKATAGSGKTTTLIGLAQMLPYGKRSLFTAFNKSIVAELKTRLPVATECSTLHSLGAKAIFRHYPNGTSIDEKKQIAYIMPYFADAKPKEKWANIYQVDRVMKLARATMAEVTKEGIEKLVDDYALDFEEKNIGIVVKALRKYHEDQLDPDRYNMKIDFTDMIESVVRNPEIVVPKYDFIFVDEVQDFSKMDRLFIQRFLKPKGRFIAVGDPHQCQPTGTKILLADKSEKNIEDVVVGDLITRYSLNNGCKYMFNGIVEEVSSREVEEQITRVILGNKSTSRYTFNHKCLVKFTNDTSAYALYLMRKGDMFRIGMAKWRGGVTNKFLNARYLAEKADALWILSIGNKKDIEYAEQKYSYGFGVPQLSWMITSKSKNKIKDQKNLDKLWSELESWGIKERAISLLEFFNRDIQYPLWTKGGKKSFGVWEINAINLIPDFMLLNEFSDNKNAQDDSRKGGVWHPIKMIVREKYKGKVYSLKTKEGNYVADGILTHNSIYGFRGAAIDSFEQFATQKNTIILPLSICYRCTKKIVREAKKINNEIEENPNGEEGLEINEKAKIEDIREGDFVLCRNTRPLIDIFFKLIESNKKAYVVGKEMEKGLLAILVDYNSFDKTDLAAKVRLNDYRAKLLASLKEKGYSHPEKHPKMGILDEKIQILQMLFDKFSTVGEVESFISRIFEDEERDGIRLSTIHRAKGLENDRVFVIRTYGGVPLIPSPYAATPDQHKQEVNLAFVSVTRAKKELNYLNL